MPPEPPAPPEEPPSSADAPAVPAAAPEPQAMPADELDEGAIAALTARLAAAQGSVTSTQMKVYMSIAASFPGEPEVAIDDTPLMTITEVGDLAHAEVDIAGFMAALFGAAGPGAGSESVNLPLLEMILEGETGLYLKLAPLMALDPSSESPWPADLVAEHGGDLDDLWGFVDLTSAGGAEVLASLGVTPQTAMQDDFVEFLAEGLPEGALLSVRSGGPSEVAGIETQGYSFVLDLAALAEFPAALGMMFGGNPGETGAPAGDFPGGLGGSLPFEYVIQVDSDDLIRRIVVVVDIGAILAGVFNDLAQTGEVPEGAEAEFPEIEYVLSMRMDVIALNDPSLVVEIPDPSLVVDLPIPLLGVDLS